MAQTLATPNDVRHGFSKFFSFVPSSDGSVGRITAISITKQNNILVCDNKKNQLILFDKDGGYLECLNLDSSPSDIAISDDNVAFVTLPNNHTVLQVDPDRLSICSSFVSEITYRYISCVTPGGSEVEYGDEQMHYVYLGYSYMGSFRRIKISNGEISDHKLEYSSVCVDSKKAVKYYVYVKDQRDLSKNVHFYCVVGQNHVGRISTNGNKDRRENKTYIQSPTLLGPSDICSDDNGHIYVSGQYSHNIYRLTEEGNIVDIPLSEKHGLKYPVAMSFNTDFTKLYIVHRWGKEVLVLDVI